MASSKALPANTVLLPEDIKSVLVAATRVAVVPSRRSLMERETVRVPAVDVVALINALEESFPGLVAERQREGRNGL